MQNKRIIDSLLFHRPQPRDVSDNGNNKFILDIPQDGIKEPDACSQKNGGKGHLFQEIEEVTISFDPFSYLLVLFLFKLVEPVTELVSGGACVIGPITGASHTSLASIKN